MIEAVIFDYARTIANPDINPPVLYDDVLGILDQIKRKGIKMALLSRGQDESLRRAEIQRLGLTGYFAVIDVVGQSAEKDFRPVIEQLNIDATKCIVVGDRVRQEIKYGNHVGATTVWLRRDGGKFTDEQPQASEEQPKFIIKSLNELTFLIDTFR